MSKFSKFTQKSERIIKHINQETGLDFTKYQNPEFIGKITDVIMIQKYTAKALYKPILIALALFICGFFLFKMTWIGAVIYGIFAFVAFMLIGFSYGTLTLLSNLRQDLKMIVDTSLNMTSNICQDFVHTNGNIQNIENPMGLIFEGIVASTVSPALTATFVKIPVAGGLLMSGSDKAMDIVVKQFKIYENKTNIRAFIGNQSNNLVGLTGKLDNIVTQFGNKTSSYIDNGFRLVQYPTRIVFGLSICFALFFILIFSIF